MIWQTSNDNSILLQIKKANIADENFSLTVSKSANEVVATYTKDETKMDLIIRLPASYPLRPVDVECMRSLGISEVKQRKWLMSMMLFVRNQVLSLASYSVHCSFYFFMQWMWDPLIMVIYMELWSTIVAVGQKEKLKEWENDQLIGMETIIFKRTSVVGRLLILLYFWCRMEL